MTGLSLLLFQNGLPDLPVVLIEPHRNRGGIWRIKFCYDADQPLSMSAEQASSLATIYTDWVKTSWPARSMMPLEARRVTARCEIAS